MGGIYGFCSNDLTGEHKSCILNEMGKAIRFRGPDGLGKWLEEDTAIGHNKLATNDLVSNETQPMASPDERYVISLDGEIYNSLEIKKDLVSSESGKNIGKSDAEVILYAIMLHGLDWTLKHIKGCFAFVLYDKEKKVLTLARDRMGEKPLFYGKIKESFVFASDLKAIYKYPGAQNAHIDAVALSNYLKYGYITAPKTVWIEFSELLPGTYIEYDCQKKVLSEPRLYFDIEKCALQNVEKRTLCLDDYISELDIKLTDAIEKTTRSNSPIGVFLSGGTDSSLVLSLMNKKGYNINTFSVGINGEKMDEAKDAKKIASYFGTKHTEIYFDEKQIREFLPNIAENFSEPYGDNSAVVTYFLCKEARQKVKAAISGDGSDELFGGYDLYSLLNSYLPVSQLDTTKTALARYKNASVPDMKKLYYWYDEKLDNIIINGKGDLYRNIGENSIKSLSPQNQWMLSDQKNYLVYDCLAKADRCSMAASLEVRAPFLYQDVVEFSWSVPTDIKIKGDITKYIVKELLYRYIPKEMMERPKKGFNIPISKIIHENRNIFEWAHESITKVKKLDFINPDEVELFWKNYTDNGNWRPVLWYLIMLENWMERKQLWFS